MDKEALVKKRIDETRKLIDLLSEDHQLVVTAAFWMDSVPDDKWTLTIVSPKFDEDGMKGGYLPVVLTYRKHPDIEVDIDVILPRRPDDPTVREVLDFVDTYPASKEVRERGIFLKGHFVDRAYIYPINLDVEAVPQGSGARSDA